MNGSNKTTEKDPLHPPIQITVSADDEAEADASGGDTKILNPYDEDLDYVPRNPPLSSHPTSRKASFFIGEEDTVAVTIVGPDNEEITPDDIVVAPDGGYGYVIVVAAFLTNFVIDGTIFSFGIILDEIIKKSNGTVEPDRAAWIGSLLTGFYLMAGPLVSSLCNKLGFRWTGIIGSVIATAGFILAWYFSGMEVAPNLTALFIFYGVIGGIGFGLAYVPSIICVGFYFSKKRALATGIAICGSGIGTFVYAPLVALLISEFGWQGALLIQGALIFTCVLFAALYRPLEPPKTTSEKDESAQQRAQSPEGTPLLMRMKRARELEKWDSRNSFSTSVNEGDGGAVLDSTRRSVPNALILNGGPPTLNPPARDEQQTQQSPTTRKASANSLPGVQLLQGPPAVNKVKRLSIPTVISGDSSSGGGGGPTAPPPVQQRTPSLRNKSFAGLPLPLMEIDEEDGEGGGSGSGGSNEEIKKEEGEKDKKQQQTQHLQIEQGQQQQQIPPNLLTPRRSIYLRRNSTMTGMADHYTNKFGRKNSGLTLVLSSSAIQPQLGQGRASVGELSQSRILRVSTSKAALNKPLLRDDIFYHGSLNKLPEYKNNVDAIFSSVEWMEPPGPFPRPDSAAAGLEDQGVKKKSSKFLILKKMLDLSLLRSPTFLILAISGAITMLGFFIPFIYLKAIAETRIDATAATFLISIIGISNTVGRILCGALADRDWVNPLIINNAALSVGGLATICLPLLGSHALLILYSVVFGVSVACFASLRSILLVELLGLSKLTNAFGLLCLFQGIAALVGSPMAGSLKVATGDYAVTFYVAGAMMLVSGILCFPLHCINDWERRREDRRLLAKNGGLINQIQT